MTDKLVEKKPRAVEGAPAISQEAVSGTVIVTGDSNVQVGSGGVAAGWGAVAAGAGGVAVGRNIHGEIFIHEGPPRVLSQDQAFERIGAAVRSNLGQLERNIEKARAESSQFFKLTLVFASLGFLIVLAGVGLLLAEQIAAGIVSTLSALIPEVTAALFFKKDQELRGTIERYHQHVLDSQRLLTMIDVAETVSVGAGRDELKKQIVWKALDIEPPSQPTSATDERSAPNTAPAADG